jgi:predicted phage-related endonuclease
LIGVETEEEFLKTRKDTIGGSDISTIIGKSKMNTRFRLYNYKKSLERKASNKFMDAGNMLEEPIRERFYNNRGVKDKLFTRNSKDEILYVSHPSFPFIVVHPDDIFNDGILLEIKTTQKYVTDSTIEALVLEDYYDQWNFTLGVLLDNDPQRFSEHGFIIVFSRGVDYFEVPVRFNRDLYQKALEEAIKFKQLIEQNIPPELSDGDLDEVYTLSSDTSVYMTEEMSTYFKRLSRLIRIEKKLLKEKEELIFYFKRIMKDSERVVDSDTGKPVIFWKTTAKSRVFRVILN